MRTSLRSLFLVAALSVTNTSCIKSMILKGQIRATKDASSTFNSIGDYELARGAASAGLVQFEGMHELAPDNEDALFLLTRSWVAYGFAFPEDDYEAAMFEKGDDELAEYHKGRAKMAYSRAVHYGVELLKKRADGFDAAKKNSDTIHAWLRANFTEKEQAATLFWTGYGWLARVNIEKEEPALVADLFIGVAILERSVELDPTYQNYGGFAALGSYHARNSIAELDQAKMFFEKSVTLSRGRALLNTVAYASRYGCVRQDRALYEKYLKQAIELDDSRPEFDDVRLSNAVAKRRARRYLGRNKMMDCGFEMPSGTERKAAEPLPKK